MNSYCQDIIFVDSQNINKDLIQINKKFTTENKEKNSYTCDIYHIMYSYGENPLFLIQNKLSVLFKNICLSQKRYNTRIFSNNSCYIPLNTEYETYKGLENNIMMIRNIMIDNILSVNKDDLMFNIDHINELRKKKIEIQMMHKGKLCRINFMESNKSTEIKTINTFDTLIKNYKNNNEKTGTYYLADFIIRFKCSVYQKKELKENNKFISFVPYLKCIEIRSSKNNNICHHIINTNSKIIMLDNILVL
jgi:hypothetical protein